MGGERSKSGAGLVTVEALGLLVHDLRAPLAALTVWCEVLAGAVDEAMRAQAVRAILASVQAQERAIEELADVARLADGRIRIARREVDLRAVARRAIARAQPIADERGARLKLAVEPAEARAGDGDGAEARGRASARTRGDVSVGIRGGARALRVDGDPERLEHLFAHLLRRAIKSAASGSAVTLSLAPATRAGGVRASIAVDSRAAGDTQPIRRGRDFDLFVADYLAGQHGARLSAGTGAALFVVELPPAARRLVRAARTRRRS